MSRKLLLSGVLVAIMAMFMVGCNKTNTKVGDVVVTTESVFEGAGLPVRFAFSDFSDQLGRFEVRSVSVGLFVLEDDDVTPYNSYTIKDVSGVDLKLPGWVGIPRSGKLDLFFVGLEAGTYKIDFSMKVEERLFERSVVAVIKSKGGPDVPPVPEDGIDDFTLPELSSESGKCEMYVGERIEFVPTITPSDIDVSFWVSSSNSNIAEIMSSDGKLIINAIAEGECVMTVAPDNVTGPTKTFGVLVKAKPEEKKVITDFSIPSMDPEYQKLCVESDKDYVFKPSVTPSDVEGVIFSAESSDESVAETECLEDGSIIIKGKAPGYCSISVFPSNAEGPTKSIPVLVFRNVVVTVDFYELNATDEEITNKTFPCYLRFSSDSPYAFNEPIVWTVTYKYVVARTGQDSKSAVGKEDVSFKGKSKAYFDVRTKVLIRAFEEYRNPDYVLRVSLSLAKNFGLDPAIWRVTFNEVWKEQDGVRIKQYLSWDLQ